MSARVSSILWSLERQSLCESHGQRRWLTVLEITRHTMNSSETVREAIFALLKPTSTPLTATELRIRLRVKALKLAEYEVLHALRYLRSEGLVRLERGRWSATAPFANASVLGPTAHQPAERHGSHIYSSTTSLDLSPAAPTAWSPNKSRVLNNVPQAEEPTHPAAEPVDFSGPWGTFRRLVGLLGQVESLTYLPSDRIE